MQAAIHSTSSKVRRSWKHSVGIAMLVVVTVVTSTIFGLLTLGARPAVVAGSAMKVDPLSFEREQKERDEAEFAATWAEYSAPAQPAAGTPRPVEIKVIFATECGVDCLTLMWPDGNESTTSLSIAFDYAAICGCTIVMQAP